MLNKPRQLFVRLSPDHKVFPGKKGGHSIYADGSAAAPVLIHCFLEGAAQQNVRGFVGWQSNAFGNFHKRFYFADIFDIDEISAEKRIMDFVALVFSFGP